MGAVQGLPLLRGARHCTLTCAGANPLLVDLMLYPMRAQRRVSVGLTHCPTPCNAPNNPPPLPPLKPKPPPPKALPPRPIRPPPPIRRCLPAAAAASRRCSPACSRASWPPCPACPRTSPRWRCSRPTAREARTRDTSALLKKHMTKLGCAHKYALLKKHMTKLGCEEEASECSWAARQKQATRQNQTGAIVHTDLEPLGATAKCLGRGPAMRQRRPRPLGVAPPPIQTPLCVYVALGFLVP